MHGSRKELAKKLRVAIAETAAARDAKNFGEHLSDGPYGGVNVLVGSDMHVANGDEAKVKDFAGNFSKGLVHDQDTGLVKDPGDYKSFAGALKDIATDTGFPGNNLLGKLDGLMPGFSGSDRRLVNPLAGAAADVTGIDPFGITIPPAPELGSKTAGVEMVELYWMALLRDVPFDQWQGHDLFAEAVSELDKLNQKTPKASRFAEHYIPKSPSAPHQDLELSSKIDATTAFRGSATGNSLGDYISQFLIQDVPFGTIDYEQRQNRLKSENDYLTSWRSWLEVQNGKGPQPSRRDLELPDRRRARHIVTLRDLAHYVHFDALHEAYFNAALILDGQGAQMSPANPYFKKRATTKQGGFGTYGGPHILAAVTEVATRALKAVWHQKWEVELKSYRISSIA
jgi:hypothetical protein